MAISNYDQLFGPTTMTDAFGTTRSIPGSQRPDMYTGMMDAKSGVPVGTSVGITDRGRGMPGEMGAYEMIGGTPVAIGDVLGRQQALEKADFYEEPSNTNLSDIFDKALSLGSLVYTGPYQGAVKGLNLANNIRTGKVGQIASGIGYF